MLQIFSHLLSKLRGVLYCLPVCANPFFFYFCLWLLCAEFMIAGTYNTAAFQTYDKWTHDTKDEKAKRGTGEPKDIKSRAECLVDNRLQSTTPPVTHYLALPESQLKEKVKKSFPCLREQNRSSYSQLCTKRCVTKVVLVLSFKSSTSVIHLSPQKEMMLQRCVLKKN